MMAKVIRITTVEKVAVAIMTSQTVGQITHQVSLVMMSQIAAQITPPVNLAMT